MITGIIKSLLSIVDSLLGLRLLRERRAADPVQEKRREQQQQVKRDDHAEQQIAKAAAGDKAALDELRRLAGE